MNALVFHRNIPKYLLSRSVYRLRPRAWSTKISPLNYEQIDPPTPKASGWVSVQPVLSGICGTDLSTLTGGESFYFEPEATFPHVPGHEIVGRIVDGLDEAAFSPGDRVAVWPPIGCRAKGFDEFCPQCARGWDGLCMRRDEGWPDRGTAIGFNKDTSGGWSERLIAHHSQLWRVPDGVSDEQAMLLEPASTSLAAMLRTERPDIERTLIIGGSSIGLMAAHIHRGLCLSGECHVLVRHRFQQQWLTDQGIEASLVRGEEAFKDWASGQGILSRKIIAYGEVFDGVFDRVVVAAASQSAFDWAIRTVRPGGQIALVSAPATLRKLDPTPLWYREITLKGINVYGPVPWQGEMVHPFEVLIDGLAGGSLSFRNLITHTFPLHQYQEAIGTALNRSGSGAIKVAFKA